MAAQLFLEELLVQEASQVGAASQPSASANQPKPISQPTQRNGTQVGTSAGTPTWPDRHKGYKDGVLSMEC